MEENTVLLEAVTEQNVIYVVLFIPKEKRNLYVKSLEKFYIIIELDLNHENSNYWCIGKNRLQNF